MTLQVAAGSPWWLVAAANLILFLHIAGRTVGILSGAAALLARKGGCLHRVAGTVFLVSMLTMATIGAAASPFLPVPPMPNVFAGILTFYLEVLRVAIGRAFKLLVMGSAAGLGLGLLAARVLAFIVYQATPRDPSVLAGVVLAMLVLGLLATWIPARRALSIDPLILLREE